MQPGKSNPVFRAHTRLLDAEGTFLVVLRLYPFLENGSKVELQVYCLCQLVRADGNPDIEPERLTLSGPVPIFGISIRSHDMQKCHRLAANTTALSLGPAFTRSVRNG